ncbi:MAG: hypothetical protein LBR05_08920 [Azoarcus sp.]|jgi:predicted DNA-binding protein|nr:hypothetical protein [Azoarcus sp.]
MTTPREQTVTVGVRLEKPLADRLAVLAEKSGRPMSYYVKASLIECLPMHEAVQQAEQNYRDMLAGKIEYVPHEQVKAELLARRKSRENAA